ncbi:MAG: 30S ribosomal protein S17 [Candidatus Omnitrophica bacterium]|nr:30S ribosomal protein S17 [Candidatus Omnitrophota bacterium]
MGRIEGVKKQRVGIIVSDKMNKTRVIRIERLAQHPLYKKRIRKFVNIKAHDEKNEAKLGDKVRIMETRPLSSDKRWRIIEIIKAHKE